MFLPRSLSLPLEDGTNCRFGRLELYFISNMQPFYIAQRAKSLRQRWDQEVGYVMGQRCEHLMYLLLETFSGIFQIPHPKSSLTQKTHLKS